MDEIIADVSMWRSPNGTASHCGRVMSTRGTDTGGGAFTGVGTSVDGPDPGAIVIFSPLSSSGITSFAFM